MSEGRGWNMISLYGTAGLGLPLEGLGSGGIGNRSNRRYWSQRWWRWGGLALKERGQGWNIMSLEGRGMCYDVTGGQG